MALKAKFSSSDIIEAGCDEAGRGCLAGPVVCASVILPNDFSHPLLNDSKKMSKNSRDLLREIIEREALSWSVVFMSNEEVDKLNVLRASIEGMQKAALQLEIKPSLVLVDGNRFKPFEIPHVCIVKGDSKFLSIAAASVLAKTHRDEFMLNIHQEFPEYQWDKNKGYPSLVHRKQLLNLGPSSYHRKSFKLKETSQLMLDL